MRPKYDLIVRGDHEITESWEITRIGSEKGTGRGITGTWETTKIWRNHKEIDVNVSKQCDNRGASEKKDND